MTHEPKPRTAGDAKGPESDEDLPDARTVPWVANADELVWPEPVEVTD